MVIAEAAKREQAKREQVSRRLAVVPAAAALLAITTGALLTDKLAGLSAPHWILGVAAAVFSMPLLGNRLAWRLIVPGLLLALLPVPPAMHALCAPLLLGGAASAVFLMPVMVSSVSPLLRNLIVAAPVLVLMQIVLGAAHRHKAIAVVWHLAGAMTVAGVMVMLCVVLLRRIAAEKALRLVAGWLIGILVTQVTLGMAALLLRMLDMDATVIAAAHVMGGSLTFAASLMLLRATQRS